MEKKVKIRQIETTNNKVAFLKMRHHALRTACIKTSSGVVICVFRSSHLILVLLLILLSLRDPIPTLQSVHTQRSYELRCST